MFRLIFRINFHSHVVLNVYSIFGMDVCHLFGITCVISPYFSNYNTIHAYIFCPNYASDPTLGKPGSNI